MKMCTRSCDTVALCWIQRLEIFVNWSLIFLAALFICCCIYRAYIWFNEEAQIEPR